MPTASPRNGEKAGFHFTGPLAGIGNSMLQRFGVRTAERARGAGPSGKPEAPEVQYKGIPLPVLLWLGARLPFGAFVAILVLFTYTYHMAPILPWLMSFFCLAFATIVCWPPKFLGTKKRDFWDWGPMYSWLLAIGFAIIFGLINYGIIESWINTTFLREYKGVRPSTEPNAVMDAGILDFSQDAMLDTSSSAGYKFWFSTFCAAPIVDRNDPNGAPITFWAVGVGCCAPRGGFTCDSAQDKTAHKGVPLKTYNLGPEITSHYNHAIRMAASTNDLEVAKETVYVLWHKDPKAVGKERWWLCTVIFVVLTLIALCSCCGCQSAFVHLDVMKKSSVQ